MRSLAITKKVLRELLRDKRTLVMMFLAPVFIMWLLNVMFSANNSTEVTIAAVGVDSEIVKALDKVDGVTVKEYDKTDEAQDDLETNKVDAVIETELDNHYDVTYANTDSSKTTLTKQALQSAISSTNTAKLTAALQNLQSKLGLSTDSSTASTPKITNHYHYGDADSGFFSKMIPILMGFFVFFFVFLISGMALLKERTSGTLDRLLATPVKRSDIVFGYMLSYGLVALIQTAVIVLSTIWLLDVEVVGSIVDIIVINVLLALVALAFGILLSTLAKSEFQMMQFIPLVVMPQMFFSGIIPLNSMADWVQVIGKFLPLSYSGDALTKIIMYGKELTNLGWDILVLLVFIAVLTVLNIEGLRRYRKV